jgi:hypothetical protein
MTPGKRRGQRGQTLVILAGGVAGLLALVGLVVDGANAYAQHRSTQNAADAASQAGAAVLARAILEGEAPVDFDIKHAINAVAADNRVNPFYPFTANASAAYYTDIDGNMITTGGGPARVGGGMPSCSTGCIDGRPVGVRAVAVRPFRALLAGIVGQTDFVARTEATSVAGYLEFPCDAETGCPLLPLAVSLEEGSCQPGGPPVYTGTLWDVAEPDYTSANATMLPTCDLAADEPQGPAAWLDYECGSLRTQIRTPCNNEIEFPSWIPSWDGGMTGVATAMNEYAGTASGSYEVGQDRVVLMPVFDAVCHEDKGDGHDPDDSTFPGVCRSDPSSGKIHYRTPKFVAFVIDSYLDGSAISGCTVTTTRTFTTGGIKACVKGWFANSVLPPGPVTTVPFGDGMPKPLTIQLIK